MYLLPLYRMPVLLWYLLGSMAWMLDPLAITLLILLLLVCLVASIPSVTTQNSSNVQTVTQQEFLVVGLSNVGSDIFEFKSSKVGDVITLEAYVKNLHYSLADGIREL